MPAISVMLKLERVEDYDKEDLLRAIRKFCDARHGSKAMVIWPDNRHVIYPHSQHKNLDKEIA